MEKEDRGFTPGMVTVHVVTGDSEVITATFILLFLGGNHLFSISQDHQTCVAIS